MLHARHVITSPAHAMTSARHALTSAAHAITSPAHAMTSARHELTSMQQHITAAPHGLLTTLYDVTAGRHDVTAGRHDVTAACYELNGLGVSGLAAGRVGLLLGFFVDADAATLLHDQRAVAVPNQQLRRQKVGICSWTIDVVTAPGKRMQRQSGQRDDSARGQI